MKILGIDTSTDICGIALAEDRTLISEFRSNIKRAHAEKIIYAIDRVLSDAHLRINEIDAIAISIGPGSFTGLRIGLAAVKGLAFASQLPVVAVPSLDVLALQAFCWREQICPLIRAQADEAYTALYRFQNCQLIRLSDYRLITLNSLGDVIKQKTLILNIGIKNLQNFVSRELSTLVELAPPEFSMTSGYMVVLSGYDEIIHERFEDIENLEPFYLKDFKAKKKHGL